MTFYLDYIRAIGLWLFGSYIFLWITGAGLQVTMSRVVVWSVAKS